MAYFPDHKLLYGADLVFPNRAVTGQPGAGYFETSLVDLRNAVGVQAALIRKHGALAPGWQVRIERYDQQQQRISVD